MKLNLKERKGITLIALVITIIVLLILAGVSIAMLTGQNGILTQANNAKTSTANKSAEEKVKLAVMAARLQSEDASLDLEKLTAEVTTNYGGQVDGGAFPATVTIDGKSFTVDSDGNVEFSVLGGGNWEYDHATQTVKKGNLELKIGDYVNDKGTQNVSGFDGKWRVLGVEDGQLLLVTDTYYAPFAEDTTNGITRSSPGSIGPDLYGLQLSGKDGYDNGVARLNKIGEQYNNSKLEKGRSINVNDINKITGYNPNNTGVNDPGQTGTGTPFGNGNAWQYKNKVTYTLEGGKVWYQGTNAATTKTQSSYTTFKLLGETNNISSPTQLESTVYVYDPTTLTVGSDDTKSVGLAKGSVAYNMLFTPQYAPYWLASPCVYAGAGIAFWGMLVVSGGHVSSGGPWVSSIGSYSGTSGVRPAVSLKSNITPTLKSTDSTTGISTYEI